MLMSCHARVAQRIKAVHVMLTITTAISINKQSQLRDSAASSAGHKKITKLQPLRVNFACRSSHRQGCTWTMFWQQRACSTTAWNIKSWFWQTLKKTCIHHCNLSCPKKNSIQERYLMYGTPSATVVRHQCTVVTPNQPKTCSHHKLAVVTIPNNSIPANEPH